MNHFKDKVVYQVYPKSFQDTTGNGFGDLNGVIKRLDYLEYLGVDVVWMTPFFVSPQKDNGYDVANYYEVDPRYGTMDDFTRLCEEAKKRKMEVMLDMVLNHTSDQHVWFQKALDNDPKYKDYYILKKGKEEGTSPTNWVSKFGGNAWQYVKQWDAYYLHLFDKTQVDLNWDNPEVRQEMKQIVNFWLDKGVRGFRFDVVNLISKPKHFQDDFEGDGRRFYTDGPNVHTYLKELNKDSFGAYEGMMTVGEMSSTTLENCVRYAGENEQELSMVFSFHHLKVDYKNQDKWAIKPFDFMELKHLFHTWQLGMQEANAWNALFFSNHDQPRSLSRFGNDKTYPIQSAKMLATSLHLMRGTPYIYQGEEIGMQNAEFDSIDKYRDVESLNYYHILDEKGYSQKEIFDVLKARSRDNARTPMQWNCEPHAGFSNNTPWIDVKHNYKDYNVETQMGDKDSILEHYRTLIQLRKHYKVISLGTFEPILEQHPQVYAYKRHYNQEELLVVNNFYATTCEIELHEVDGYRLILSNYGDSAIQPSMTLRPYESIVLHRTK